jgi:hypothetical protein
MRKRLDAVTWRKTRERAIEPAGIRASYSGVAAFQHVLPVEVRALAVGCRHRVHDDGLAGLIESVQVRHRRIEGKESIERQSRRLAIEPERIVAAQLGPIGIADRRDRRESIERPAQHDGEEARVAAFRPRDPRHERPGEQRA